MKAVFEVKTIESEWKPPFRKKAETEEFMALENDGFDTIRANGHNEEIFTLVQMKGDKVQLKYSRVFTLKGYEQPQDRSFWLFRGEEKTLTYLWGEKGITKKITFKGMDLERGKPEPEKEAGKEPAREEGQVQEETDEAPAEEAPAEEEKPMQEPITVIVRENDLHGSEEHREKPAPGF